VATLGDEDVGRLDVTVDDPLGVGGVERVGDLDPQSEENVQLQRSGPDAVLQRLAVHVLHREERLPLVRANLINSADVRMVEGGGGLRLTLKSLQGLRVLGEGFREELEGDEPAEALVLGLVHDAHASAAQLLEDAIVRYRLADHGALGLRGGVTISKNTQMRATKETKNKARRIPRLRAGATEREIIRWTRAHDVFDRLDRGVSEVVADTSDLDSLLEDAIVQDNTAQLNMRIPRAMKAVLSRLARERTTDATTLARIWLAERLQLEMKR